MKPYIQAGDYFRIVNGEFEMKVKMMPPIRWMKCDFVKYFTLLEIDFIETQYWFDA